MTPLEEHRFPCTECGADLVFEPGTDHLKCPYCGAENRLSEGGSGGGDGGGDYLREIDFEATIAAGGSGAESEDARIAKCTECGAEILFSEEVHASACAFCAAPLVVDTGTSRRIKPAALLPFLKTADEARDAMSRWLGRLWFAPSALQQYARRGRAMEGIYVPFWTYDASTHSHYTGERGTVYYETRTRRVEVNGRMETRQEQIERVRWRPVSGNVGRDFDDVLVVAAEGLPRGHISALAPWDLGELAGYDPAYLAGFKAEGYTVPLEAGYTEARRIMDGVIAGDVRQAIGGDRQRVAHIATKVKDVTFKHVLLPVWLASYRFNGKRYHFVVNGRTGKVKGERPWSVVKIAVTAVAAALVIALLVWFFGQNGG